jgi:hypothetical protein
MPFSQTESKLLDTSSVSETLEKLARKDQKGSTKILDILEDFHENGILLAMIFFALPISTPLPSPPGFTTIIAMPLIILSIQMIFGSKRIKLPQKINNYEIKNSTLKLVNDKIVPIIKAIEKYTKPRLGFAKSVYCEQFIGFLSFVAAISIAIPLPLTNALPALGISVMALGLLNRDGIVIIIGCTITIIGLTVALSAVLASWMAIKYLFHSIF